MLIDHHQAGKVIELLTANSALLSDHEARERFEQNICWKKKIKQQKIDIWAEIVKSTKVRVRKF